MTMFASLIFLILLVALSLVTVSLINERERRRQSASQRLKVIRKHLQQMEEIALEVDRLTENRGIARFINDEILSAISSARENNPDALFLDAHYQTALLRGETLVDEDIPQALDRLKDSDTQIRRSQQLLEDAAALLRRQQAAGHLSFEDMNVFLSDLGWAHLMVNVISHVGQGHRAIHRGDVLSAHSFYKKAQQLLSRSSHPDPRRHRFIKELTEVLTHKRKAISEDMMPETQLNPPPGNPSETRPTLTDQTAPLESP